MRDGDLLRAAADVLRRSGCTTCTCEQTRALADVLIHEAAWAETDPDYGHRPEPLAIAAARILDGPARRRRWTDDSER